MIANPNSITDKIVKCLRTYVLVIVDLTDLNEADKTRNRLNAMINIFSFDNVEEEIYQHNNPINLSFTILQELYQIKDNVSIIKEQTKSLDTSAISIFADKLAINSQKSNNQVMMETLLPKILEHPELLMRLIFISDQLPKKF